MGSMSSSSSQGHSFDKDQLLQDIQDNDVKSFKNNIKHVDPTYLNDLLLETIARERKEILELLLDQLKIVVYSRSSIYTNKDYEEYCSFIFLSLIPSCSKAYYALRLIEVYKEVVPSARNKSLLHLAVQFQNKVLAHHILLNGENVNSVDTFGRIPLEEAIECCNLELVCMLLYYGAYTSNCVPDTMTSFMYSIIFFSSEEIQRTLLEYESDFNLCYRGKSTLFLAVENNSPLILDIIDRGGNVNYSYERYNIISIVIYSPLKCKPDIFRVLWKKFDYEVWKKSFSKSLLLLFLQEDEITSSSVWLEYLYVLMENEDKLKLIIQHHNNSYFFNSDLLISKLYLRCVRKGLSNKTTESFIFHLLSHGAYIFAKDVDRIYNELGTITPFLKLLLYMDIWNSEETSENIMYFKYTPIPDLNKYLIWAAFTPNVLLDSLKKLRRYYAFNSDLRATVLDIVGTEDSNYGTCKEILEKSVLFPSLMQLARDSAKNTICTKYHIKNSCKLNTIIRYLPLPKYIKDIILFDRVYLLLYMHLYITQPNFFSSYTSFKIGKIKHFYQDIYLVNITN